MGINWAGMSPMTCNPTHMKKTIILPLAVLSIAGFSWLAFGFFGIQALFTNQEVDESIPDAVSQAMSDGTGDSESLLGQGAFTQGDSTYTIAGQAFLTRGEVNPMLTFTDFEVSNGPDLFVYAVKSPNTDNKTVKDAVAAGDFINLGTLKGNIGNHNYELDDTFNSEDYPVIAIWCRRFGRNFGSANLADL